MGANLSTAGNDLVNVFQGYVSGDGACATTTNITGNGNDIKTLFAARDNKSTNSVASTFFRYGGVDIAGLFNKRNSTYDIVIGGSSTFTGSVQTSGIVYSGQTPTANAIASGSTFTIGAPTANVTSDCITAGTYTFPSSNTTISITSTATSTQRLVLNIPGNYLPGTVSGSYVIFPVAPYSRSLTFSNAASAGLATWSNTSNVTDGNPGDVLTFTTCTSSSASAVWTSNGTATFTAQAITIGTANVYIQYGVTVNHTGLFGYSPASGSVEYSVNSGSTWTTIATWTEYDTTKLATGFIIPSASVSAVTNLNQIRIRINAGKGSGTFGGQPYNSSVFPRLYDIYATYI